MSVTPTLRVDPDGRVYALSGGDLSTANAVLRRTEDGRVSAVTVDELTEWEPGDPGEVEDAWVSVLARDGSISEPQPYYKGGVVVETAAGRSPARFTKWAGSTGDIMDGVLRLKGPFTKVTITQGGKTVTAEVARSASQYLFIDPTEFTAWTGGANAWEPTASRVALDYGAGGALTALSPGPDGVEVSVSGDGLTSASSVTLRGRRWWL